eukprot:gnl/TRDRNA2_/TRDRNA2_153183_c0_seq3.p1 gnl/TRDRNA2_/TRDRNA2_153183_c0~~gnl/TRDRNA2_/TRDRNA2_153183_c0_seq3.p1  ORF type:complete len:214 (+),score=11.52 gnl/TRDRNA2_/TRDRNA2_153183_c0_seq3:449-1090(+)
MQLSVRRCYKAAFNIRMSEAAIMKTASASFTGCIDVSMRPGWISLAFFVYRRQAIIHDVVPDDTWVEVMRIARVDDKLGAIDKSMVGQIWFWKAEGSGIWWNVGKSMHLRGPVSCLDARRRGYDSIQIPASFRGFSSELIDCRGMDLPHGYNETWQQACPPPHVKLLTGVPEERYAPALHGVTPHESVCRCHNEAYYLNCENTAARATSRIAN